MEDLKYIRKINNRIIFFNNFAAKIDGTIATLRVDNREGAIVSYRIPSVNEGKSTKILFRDFDATVVGKNEDGEFANKLQENWISYMEDRFGKEYSDDLKTHATIKEV